MSYKSALYDKSAVHDYLACLYLDHPDYSSRVFSPTHSLEGAIQIFVDGLNTIQKQLGEERHQELLAKAYEVKSLFQTGDSDDAYKARGIINYMSALMKAKKSLKIDIEPYILPRAPKKADPE
jgi:hypothetical protein